MSVVRSSCKKKLHPQMRKCAQRTCYVTHMMDAFSSVPVFGANSQTTPDRHTKHKVNQHFSKSCHNHTVTTRAVR